VRQVHQIHLPWRLSLLLSKHFDYLGLLYGRIIHHFVRFCGILVTIRGSSVWNVSRE